QYAINTWNWPVFVALSAGALAVGSWAGKKAGIKEALIGSALGLVGWALSLGIGRILMHGFRHYFIQDSGSRIGTVVPTEWQMVGYIPLAYFGFGLAG